RGSIDELVREVPEIDVEVEHDRRGRQPVVDSDLPRELAERVATERRARGQRFMDVECGPRTRQRPAAIWAGKRKPSRVDGDPGVGVSWIRGKVPGPARTVAERDPARRDIRAAGEREPRRRRWFVVDHRTGLGGRWLVGWLRRRIVGSGPLRF